MSSQLPPPTVESPASTLDSSPRNGGRVLVVDDATSIRMALCTFLQEHGYDVKTATDAVQALALLAAEGWDVVMTDVVLPGVSGVELLKAIRAAAPNVQVIMMTGEPSIETAAEAMRAGARDYLTKPAVKNAILRSLATAVAIKRIEDEKRRLEEENRKYQNNLEELVAERTQALQYANRQLETALAEVRRNQEEIIKQERLSALGQMVGGIAHDFNNALMPIVGLSSYFLSVPGALSNPEALRADLEAIRSAAESTADIVKRLREFYRPDEALSTTDVDLGKLWNQVTRLTEPAWKVQAAAEGRSIRVVNDIGDFPPIPANEPRLREALVDLVLNAVDAMPKGGAITFSAEREAENIALRLSDTGSGMPEDVRKRCFEPFFTTKGKRGSGLGLAVVYGIVTRHGGQITVESQLDVGTTFVIRLPQAARPATEPVNKAGLPVNGPAPKFRILVVDDEERTRDLVSRFLSLNGHTVLTAASGHDALDTFSREPVDLVITDRAMPDLSGDRLAAEIKRVSPTTPVIMLTGFGDIMDVRREKPAGVDTVLGKPVTPDQIQEAVTGTMRKRT